MKNLSNFAPRIITGEFKGKRLKVPEGARPVTDRVKKTIFDILGENVIGKNVLDLFSGSGNLGIEALSRGATNITFVDESYEATEAIKENTRDLPTKAKIRIIKDNYYNYLRKLKGVKFNLIFIDPPFSEYDKINFDLIIEVTQQNGLIVLKSPKEIESLIKEKLEIIEKRVIGSNILYFLSPTNN